MKNSALIFLLFVVFYSCSNQTEQKKKIENEIKIEKFPDTIIGKKKIENEIKIEKFPDTIIGKKNITEPVGYGYVRSTAFSKIATQYFVVVKKDTSEFMPIFSKYKSDGIVSIHISHRLPRSNKTETYFQLLSELKLILPEAAKEFNLDSLRYMSIGRRLTSYGDLAIAITKEYKNKFGEKEVIHQDYSEISKLLLESKLTKDLNKLFEPYSMSVEKARIAKPFFTTRDNFLKYSRVSKDTADIPNKIINGVMPSVIFKNK